MKQGIHVSPGSELGAQGTIGQAYHVCRSHRDDLRCVEQLNHNVSTSVELWRTATQ